MRTFLAAAAGIAVLVVAAPASAHVTVTSPGARQGGYATLTFTVPTESDTAATTGLTVQLPTDTPIASVTVQPKPGWTWRATRTKLGTPVTTDDGQVTEAISRIDWSATGGGIRPGEFDQFVLSAGPLPKVDSLTFKVLQTYSDGTVTRWIETPAPGSDAQPEHPAPSLVLTATSGAQDGSSPPSADRSTGNAGVTLLAVVAVVVAAAALGVAVVTRARADRS